MKELTKAEEELMTILWKIKKGFVKDILAEFDEPKPAYNTISTMMKILETKGFVDHTTYGKTFEYFTLVSKEEYQKKFLKHFVKNYFGNSFKQLVSFFANSDEMSIKEIEDLKAMLDTEIKNKKSNE